MGTVADGNKVYNNNPSPSAEEGLLMLRENQEAFKETFGVMPPEVLVIKDDTISPTTAICNVRTEGDASADDITTITPTLSNGTTLHNGMVLLLSAKDTSQKITLKNSAGQNGIVTTDRKDIVLSTKWYVILQFVENKWNQVSIGAPLPVSSSTVLGGVKVQTGDDDGLEMIGDKLRARQANSTQRGSVLASETAKAGAVPLGGADGSLGEDWLKKAMDAAQAAQAAAEDAQTTADEAKEAAAGASIYKKIAERSSKGNWTITGCVVGRPLKIYMTFTKQQGDSGEWGSADLITVSGADMSYIDPGHAYVVGNAGTYASTNVFELIPTSPTVVVNVYKLTSTAKLIAYN